jgi:hypothetical protein
MSSESDGEGKKKTEEGKIKYVIMFHVSERERKKLFSFHEPERARLEKCETIERRGRSQLCFIHENVH